MKTGAELIAEERRRQIEQECWSQTRDIELHKNGELAQAAVCYTLEPRYREMFGANFKGIWPWNLIWWKPTPNDRIRELVKAGALIAAEIDRLQAGGNGDV